MSREVVFELRFSAAKREFQEEIDAHLQMAIADRVARGETAETARQAAVREFGNIPLVQDVTRQMWGEGWLEQIGRDVRYALRQLRKSPGFTITATAMLAVAICANSTVFSWIDGTMLRPIPGARDTGDLVSLQRGERNFSPTPPFSYLDYRDLREQNHTFTGILAYHHDWITLTGGAQPERAYIANVSANYFDVLGIKPVLGRFFLPEEESRPSRSQRGPGLLALEDPLCRRPGNCGQIDRDCPASCNRDRRGAGGGCRSNARDP